MWKYGQQLAQMQLAGVLLRKNTSAQLDRYVNQCNSLPVAMRPRSNTLTSSVLLCNDASSLSVLIIIIIFSNRTDFHTSWS